MYSIHDAKVLLDALSRRDQVGVDFRKHFVYASTILVGDGKNFLNGIGEIGEVTFAAEVNFGDFTCQGELAEACSILNRSFYSAPEDCVFIQELYSW